MDEMYADGARAAAAADEAPTRAASTPNGAPPTRDGPARIVLLCDDDAALAGVESRVREAMPDAAVSSMPPDVALRSVAADCVVIDASVGGRSGAEALRALRAGGFAGGAVLLTEDADDADARRGARRFGATGPLRRADSGVGEAARTALEESRALACSGAAGLEVVRVRQLVAAGELALGLQHTLNNSLTALLAEAQLLEFDLTDAEHRQAAARIVDLCRRTIGVARQLDDVAPGL